jgi:FKBP-type peptidyl-prolyl cis-trans isomerase (trigger factor)
MIQNLEPREPNLTARIEELSRQYQQAVQGRQEALQLAQAHAETMLKISGAIEELQRLQTEIWRGQD